MIHPLAVRAKNNRWARARRRRALRSCENCGALMLLRFVGPRHTSGGWRRLSNRIFCDVCRCEREKARRDHQHRTQYVRAA